MAHAPANTTPAPPVDETPCAPPRTWIVLSDKQGDNAQVIAVADALGWPYEHRNLKMRPEWVFGKPKVKASLHHIDSELSDALEPPWPELILTSGRRPSLVSLWIQRQSGGKTKIVFVGKPSSRIVDYDLVIASAEHHLPPFPHVVPITLPLMRVNAPAVDAAADAWREAFADLPRPLIAVLIGGPTGPYIYDSKVTGRLLGIARHVVDEMGGTPFLTTSRRTPPNVVDALEAGLPSEARMFRWREGATDNPYLGLLAHADGFAVTADSVSMVVEVVRLGRPVAICPLSLSPLGALDQLRRSVTRRLFSSPSTTFGGRVLRRVGLRLNTMGFLNQTRDFQAFHSMLVDSGFASWIEDGFRPPTAQIPDDLPKAAESVRRLVGMDSNVRERR